MSDIVVRRIHTDTGSHIEPPLDEHASEFDRLRWHAAVVEHDTGIHVAVNQQPKGSLWERSLFGFNVGGSSIAAYDFRSAWTFLTGVRVGASAAS